MSIIVEPSVPLVVTWIVAVQLLLFVVLCQILLESIVSILLQVHEPVLASILDWVWVLPLWLVVSLLAKLLLQHVVLNQLFLLVLVVFLRHLQDVLDLDHWPGAFELFEIVDSLEFFSWHLRSIGRQSLLEPLCQVIVPPLGLLVPSALHGHRVLVCNQVVQQLDTIVFDLLDILFCVDKFLQVVKELPVPFLIKLLVCQLLHLLLIDGEVLHGVADLG